MYVTVFGSSESQIWRYDPISGALLGVFVDHAPDGLNYAQLGPERPESVRGKRQPGHSALRRENGSRAARARTIRGRLRAGGQRRLARGAKHRLGDGGNLYVSDYLANEILRYDKTTGAFSGVFAQGNLSQPHSLAFGPDGNLYVASAGNSSVVRFNSQTGAYIDTFVPSGSGGLNIDIGLAFEPMAIFT